MRRLIVLAALLTGCAEEHVEDIGARLQRECESIIARGEPNAPLDRQEYLIRGCVMRRGLAER